MNDGWFNLNRPWEQRDHPDWRKKRPLGPVTFDWRCATCKTLLAEDARLSTEEQFARIEAHQKECCIVT